MTTTLGQENLQTLHDLKTKLNLQQTEDENFFPEWYENLPEITPEEKQALHRLQERYRYHRLASPLLEGTVNLLLLSPLLEIAGLLDPPFTISSPQAVEITLTDPEETLRGLIDILVVHKQLWILVIESKRTNIPLTAALPQILGYMMANPSPNKPSFGMACNGDSFLFLKLTQQPQPQYDISDAFLLLPRRNRFEEVLRILKRLASQIS